MVELRWLRRLGPPLTAVGAFALIASVVAGASPVPADGCEAASRQTRLMSSTLTDVTPEAVADEAWFRIDPLLDDAGTLRGQRLSTGAGRRPGETIELPAESFVAGPFGDVVLVGSDDGRSSSLRVRVGRGCLRDVASERDVIRSAVLSSDGATIFEHHVDRVTRTDLGIWSRPVSGGVARSVLPPIEADGRFGRTFSTQLQSASDGGLVVQSCGIGSCRTRLLDPATGAVRTVGDAEQGVLIGAARDRLITFASCRGLPCPVVSTDIATGLRARLADATGPARLVETPDGDVIVVEVAPDGATSLQAIDVTTGSGRELAVPAGVRLVGSNGLAGFGIRLPRSWVLLSPDGRPGSAGRSTLLNVVDGSTVTLPEVRR